MRTARKKNYISMFWLMMIVLSWLNCAWVIHAHAIPPDGGAFSTVSQKLLGTTSYDDNAEPPPPHFIAQALMNLSETVRDQTQTFIEALEHVAAIPAHIEKLIQNPRTLLTDHVWAGAITLMCIVWAYLLEALFLRVASCWVRPRGTFGEVLRRALGLGLFLTISFFSVSFFLPGLKMRSLVLHLFIGLAVLRLSILILFIFYMEMKKRVGHPNEDQRKLYKNVRSLFLWLYGGYAIHILFLKTQRGSTLSLLIFGVIGFICFSLFAGVVLRIRTLLGNWVKKPMQSPKVSSLAYPLHFFGQHWPILLIVGGFFSYISLAFDGSVNHFLIKLLSSIFVIVVAQLCGTLWHYLVNLWTDKESFLNRINPIVARHVQQTLKTLTWLFYIFLYAVCLILVAKMWEIELIHWVDYIFGDQAVHTFLDIALTLVLAIIVWQGLETFFDNYMESLKNKGKKKGGSTRDASQRQRLKTLLPLVRNFLRWALGFIFSLMILAQLSLDITPLLTGLGIFGFAITLGSQSLLKDFINGLFILLDGSLALGDTVTIREHRGEIENITLRNVEIRDSKTGVLHIIPFSRVEEISNHSREFNYCTFLLEMHFDEDVTKIFEAIHEVYEIMKLDPAIQNRILGEMTIWGIKKIDGLSMTIEGRFKTEPLSAPYLRDEFYKQFKKVCIKKSFRLSSPGQVMYVSQDLPLLTPNKNEE